MSRSLSRWLTASSAAWVLVLAASTLAARGDDAPPPGVPPVTRDVAVETVEDTALEVDLPASGNGALTFVLGAPCGSDVDAVETRRVARASVPRAY